MQKEILDIEVEAEIFCPHTEKEWRLLQTIFTIEVFAKFCKTCGEKLAEE